MGTAAAASALPAMDWLQERFDVEGMYATIPPIQWNEGRLDRSMCEKKILPDTMVHDAVDWF